MTPLPPGQLLEPGAVFPAGELTRRVLTEFWRDCCCPPYFSRAPAPVLERKGGGPDGREGRAVRAWWLLDDGIIEEREGAHADRLRPYFGRANDPGRLWPSYEFRILAEPFELEMRFHDDGSANQGHRTRLVVQPDGRVRVIERLPRLLP